MNYFKKNTRKKAAIFIVLVVFLFSLESLVSQSIYFNFIRKTYFSIGGKLPDVPDNILSGAASPENIKGYIHALSSNMNHSMSRMSVPGLLLSMISFIGVSVTIINVLKNKSFTKLTIMLLTVFFAIAIISSVIDISGMYRLYLDKMGLGSSVVSNYPSWYSNAMNLFVVNISFITLFTILFSLFKIYEYSNII